LLENLYFRPTGCDEAEFRLWPREDNVARMEIMNSGETMTKTDLRQEERKTGEAKER
jgi:hypothetical protein